MSEEIKKNPKALILSMMIDHSIEVAKNVNELVTKYKHSGIDVISISEIESAMTNAARKITEDENSFTNQMLKD